MRSIRRSFTTIVLAFSAGTLVGACGGYDTGFDQLGEGTSPSFAEDAELGLTAPDGGILCPTSIHLSHGGDVGPVRAELTQTHAVCRATGSQRVEGPSQHLPGHCPGEPIIVDKSLGGSGSSGSGCADAGADGREIWQSYLGRMHIDPRAMAELVKLCADVAPTGMTSAGTWHGKTYRLSDPIFHPDNDGDFHCTWAVDEVAVDFPRMFGETRDVSTNLTNTGFYRNYHIDPALWERLCQRSCTQANTCRSRDCRGIDSTISSCVDRCVAGGW